MWPKHTLSVGFMSVRGLTSTSWVIAVSSDRGENGGEGQHAQHIHNEQGMEEGMGVARMRGEHKVKEREGETRWCSLE